MNSPHENSEEAPASLAAQKNTLKIWDLPVRLFHWGLVAAFVEAYTTHYLGATYFKYHTWCGYSVIVLTMFRLVWGLVGTYHARFINFVRPPVATAHYIASMIKKTDARHAGHNPLGGAMVIILLMALLAQAFSGLFSNDEIFNLGPLYGYVSDDLSLSLTSLHRQLFYWILGAVILHIIAVCLHVFFKRDNIVKAMLTGEKNAAGLEGVKEITSSRIGLAIIIVITLSTALTWLIYSAPKIENNF